MAGETLLLETVLQIAPPSLHDDTQPWLPWRVPTQRAQIFDALLEQLTSKHSQGGRTTSRQLLGAFTRFHSSVRERKEGRKVLGSLAEGEFDPVMVVYWRHACVTGGS